jgi:hypothetical protein
MMAPRLVISGGRRQGGYANFPQHPPGRKTLSLCLCFESRGEMAVAEMLFLRDGLLNIRAQAARGLDKTTVHTPLGEQPALSDETHYIFSSRRGIYTHIHTPTRSVSRAIFLHPDAG